MEVIGILAGLVLTITISIAICVFVLVSMYGGS